MEQLSLFEIHVSIAGCSACICRDCMLWWSDRCPYGGCWDDERAKIRPYDADHPGKGPRTWWTDWEKPGEQAHWCRGGIFYPATMCANYRQYSRPRVKACLKQNIQQWDDGYIQCGLVQTIGCERCYEEFMGRDE